MPQPFQSFRPAAAKGIEGQNLRLQGLVRPPRIFIPKCQKIRVFGLIKLCKRILHGLVPEDGGFLLASHPDLCRDAQNRRIFPDDFDGEFMDRADIRQLDIFRLGRQPGVFRLFRPGQKLPADALPHLGGRQVGKGADQHPPDIRPLFNKRDDAVCQNAGFA